MKRPKITLTLVDRMGERGCHRGHQIGDSSLPAAKETSASAALTQT